MTSADLNGTDTALSMAASAVCILLGGRQPNDAGLTQALLGNYFQPVMQLRQALRDLKDGGQASKDTITALMADTWEAVRVDPRYAALVDRVRFFQVDAAAEASFSSDEKPKKLPSIIADNEDLPAIAEEAWKALLAANAPPGDLPAGDPDPVGTGPAIRPARGAGDGESLAASPGAGGPVHHRRRERERNARATTSVAR
jgi:hypothetical protein